MNDAKIFSQIFDGLKVAFGTYRVDRKAQTGKNVGKATVVKAPRTPEHWEGHLSGKGDAIGIIPINEDNSCVWGCIDIDTYPLDHKELVTKIRKLDIPMVVCRSKSGGAHCFLFTKEWVTAKEMQAVLTHIAAALSYAGSEIFPKQVRLELDRGDTGNFLNTPYYDAEDGLRYAILDDGSAATLSEFFDLYDKYVLTPEELSALVIDEDEAKPMKDGPPCLQHLCSQKISEGGRNNGLFNLGVYLRKAFPDSWETEILNYNMLYLDPPLPLNEVNVVAKQLQKKDYAYMCKDTPIVSFCNSDLCRTRKFGIDAATSGVVIANLRKYNSQPPVWFLDVNGQPLELDTDGLMNQLQFQKSCVDQLSYMPRSMSKPSWEGRINALLDTMQQTEGSVIEVSQDASVAGQFYDYLEEWCVSMQTAKNREEILLRRPWTDEDANRTFFRLRDFENFLKKNRFFEYKTHKMAQRLRDINGEAMSLKIKGKAYKVWSIPTFGAPVDDIQTPDFGNPDDVPF